MKDLTASQCVVRNARNPNLKASYDVNLPIYRHRVTCRAILEAEDNSNVDLIGEYYGSNTDTTFGNYSVSAIPVFGAIEHGGEYKFFMGQLSPGSSTEAYLQYFKDGSWQNNRLYGITEMTDSISSKGGGQSERQSKRRSQKTRGTRLSKKEGCVNA